MSALNIQGWTFMKVTTMRVFGVTFPSTMTVSGQAVKKYMGTRSNVSPHARHSNLSAREKLAAVSMCCPFVYLGRL